MMLLGHLLFFFDWWLGQVSFLLNCKCHRHIDLNRPLGFWLAYLLLIFFFYPTKVAHNTNTNRQTDIKPNPFQNHVYLFIVKFIFKSIKSIVYWLEICLSAYGINRLSRSLINRKEFGKVCSSEKSVVHWFFLLLLNKSTFKIKGEAERNKVFSAWVNKFL